MNVEMTAKIHIPVEQYGFIEVEYSFVNGDREELHKDLVEHYEMLNKRIKEGQYEHSQVNGVNWRKKGKTWEYLEGDKWIETNELAVKMMGPKEA